ncbi:carboxymuconolactone decarboxylase family protein [Vibrio furnissii]|uniref:carboxymuconolactone decarboxylase family protein n=1 Tax=Vibrio furnissii TaxID=29494 RepID=UPI0001B92F0F|nr:carboxymuconolactone decarboxylase family protein [Vibrio furnissii]EEX40786.1 carboxymuconolactone decarboxylase [Vibrio furnissii CIP 102972]QDC95447.1 carboxymuconolactone decarboxylase family protein [Vibrio furnissii]UON50879.1 carboxymuconolactone decarboxylase family protein [Vibrio furnissii]SUQ33192.1 carboxymuconolactone decarboxylase [Vibrio furnissii]
MNHPTEQALTNQERAILPIAAFTASGQIECLKNSLEHGLDAGLTVNAIKAVLVQLYAYAGFPRSLNGLGAFMVVLESRKQRSIVDENGEDGLAMVPGDSLAVGTRHQTQLVGQAVTGALFEFAPAIDAYLKAHLFGDIFQSDVLSWKARELATIAALANMSGVNAQLQAHYGIAMNNGVTAKQLDEFIDVIRDTCGERVAANAADVLNAARH